MIKSIPIVSIVFLCIVAILGTIMRFSFVYPNSIPYSNVLHSHSHVAFQGWVYLSLFYFLITSFLSEKAIKKGNYKIQFYVTSIVIFSILVSFIYQGYGIYSIVFSSIFQFISYWFIFKFLGDLKQSFSIEDTPISVSFIKISLWLNLISTLATWSIAVISALKLGEDEIYNSAIYAFLHFQYNGWFTFAIIGLLFRFFELNAISFNKKNTKLFFNLMLLAIVPSYTLSLIGMSFRSYIIYVAYFSAVIQLIACFYFIKSINKGTLNLINKKSSLFSWVLIICFLAFLLKLFIQSISVSDLFIEMISINRFIIMAFMHMVLIGFVSFALISFYIQKEIIDISNVFVKIALYLLILGFVVSECMMVVNQFYLRIIFQKLIAYSSLSMAIGFICLLFHIILNQKMFNNIGQVNT